MRAIPAPREGDIVADRYQVLDLVGRGGQSIVYRARDVRHGDIVALKVLKGELAEDSDARERMFREAHAMATLHGTSALRVLDQQWTKEGAPCLVTEFLHGMELEDWLHAIEQQGRFADIPTLVRLLDPVVFTLEAAHEKGIVHRDLKPGNIFVIDEAHGNGVRLLDFGFAKFTRMRGFTAEHMVAGSPSYIAPEAWMGRRDLYDQRLDVYGFAAVVFRCLTGRPPFVAKDLVKLLEMATRAERPSLHAIRYDLPTSIDDWTRQALAIDPAERFLRVRGLWQAFRGIVGC